MDREFDIVIFGASGYTGQFVVEDLAVTLNRDNYKLKWAVAGRSKNKLKQVIETATKETNLDLSHVGIIEADVSDEQSILSMCKRTELVINCVGPYTDYGEQVVKACIEAGTHHVDISGESPFLEKVQLLYHKSAEEKQIYIVGSCGWDSIPSDLGVEFLKKNFDGQLNSVEAYMKVKSPKGTSINTGTWESAISVFSNLNEVKNIRRRLFSEVLNVTFLPKHKLQRKKLPFWNDSFRGWCVPFPGSDRAVVQRTQKYQFMHFNERPTQIENYFVVRNIYHLFGLALIASIFGVFTSFSWGRSLLKRYPTLFSLGVFVRGGPNKEDLKDNRFELTLVGKGWNEKQTDSSINDPPGEPDKTVIAKVTGTDCGYIATASFLVQSGLTILREKDKLPGKGGVLTPGSAFINTSIIDHLKQSNINFQLNK